jgi:hypothetical protein
MEYRASVKRFVSLLFLNLRPAVGLLGREISPSQGRYLTRTQNKHEQTCMRQVVFEPTITEFERAKTFHALDRADPGNVNYSNCIRQLRHRCDNLTKLSL